MDLLELVRLVESGQHGVPFDVKIDEAELTQIANERIGSLASDVSVDISPQAVVVVAKARVAAFVMDVQLVGKPVLADGNLRFDIDSLDLNQRPAPDFMRVQISNAINEKLEPAEMPLEVNRLELGDSWIEVAGTTK